MIFELIKHGKNLNSRPLADNIFVELSSVEDERIIVDFNGIVSASPSFCHEMFLILKKTKKSIDIINANNDIKLQLNKALSSLGDN